MEPSNNFYKENLTLLTNNKLKINDLAIENGRLVKINTFMGRIVEWAKSSFSFGRREKEKQELILSTIKYVNQNIESYKNYIRTELWNNEKISGISQYDIKDTLELVGKSVNNLVVDSEKKQEALELIVKTCYSILNLTVKEKNLKKAQEEYLNCFRFLPVYEALQMVVHKYEGKDIISFINENLPPEENVNKDPITEKINQLEKDCSPIINDLKELTLKKDQLVFGPFAKEEAIKYNSTIKNRIESCYNFLIKNENEIEKIKEFLIKNLQRIEELKRETIALNNETKEKLINEYNNEIAKIGEDEIGKDDFEFSDQVNDLYKNLNKIKSEERKYKHIKRSIQRLKSITPAQENKLSQLKKEIASLS